MQPLPLRPTVLALLAALALCACGGYNSLAPYEDECLDTATTRHLLSDTPAERLTSCPAHPLAQDKAQAQQPMQAKPAAPDVYLDPEEARRLIEEYKRRIGRTPSPRQ